MQFTVGLLKMIDERLGRPVGTFVLAVVVAAIVFSSLAVVFVLGSSAVKMLFSIASPILSGKALTLWDFATGALIVIFLVLFYRLMDSIVDILRGLAEAAGDQVQIAREFQKLITQLTERVGRLEQAGR